MTPYYRWIEVEALAAGLHRRLEVLRGEPVELPIDVDAVAEQLLGLSLLYEPIPEPPGTTIFGALDPELRLIVLNERHVEAFGRNEGLERFTKAHELGHWICHVEAGERREARGEGFDITMALRVPSLSPLASRLSPAQRERDWLERHANWFAAALLMPPGPLRKAAEDLDLGTWRGRYELRDRCGVSISALNSRLKQLGYPAVR